jgi:hypothetical protein
MTNDMDYRLTLQEAAQLGGCSIKTLYRHMTSGTLSFRVGADDRRYLSEREVRGRFLVRPGRSPITTLRQLQREVQELAERLHLQERRLEQALSLFQPRTMKDLATKQAALHPPREDVPTRQR